MLTLMKTKPFNFSPWGKSPLAAIDIFRSLPETELREIEKDSLARRCLKGEVLFRGTDQAQFIWFVQQGHVKEIKVSERRTDQIINIVGAYGIFGVSPWEGGVYGYDAVAETDATVLALPLWSFRSLIDQYPLVARDFLVKLSSLLRQAKMAQALSQECAEKRLLHVLGEIAGEFGSCIPFPRKEIASMAGTSLKTCVQAFFRLKKAGLIITCHGTITIQNGVCLKDRMDAL